LIEMAKVTFEYLPGTPLAHTALTDISLTIAEGDFVALVGPTGSGKSTLIQHLNGLLTPTSGSLSFRGRRVGSDVSPLELRREIGLIFQFPESQLFEHTVADDIGFGPRRQGLAGPEVASRVENALIQVGLDYAHYAQRSPFSLSGGEQRLVAIAGVLAMRPRFLVLDEPTSGLDACGKEAVFDCLDRLNNEGVAILMVTHSMDEVAESARRIIVLNEGKIVLDDKPERIFARASFLREIGLDIPKAAELVLRLREKGFDIEADSVSMRSVVASVAAAVKERCAN